MNASDCHMNWLVISHQYLPMCPVFLTVVLYLHVSSCYHFSDSTVVTNIYVC